jgi:hypothetical protein
VKVLKTLSAYLPRQSLVELEVMTYMSAAGEPFSAANSLGTINYEQFDELTNWDPDTDSGNFDKGEYILYLTEPGFNEPFF